ncbi:MAG TPA: GyrI-like domain-containing protein [Solirubrobacteraceae bacterium]|nr:GyrI-like domain-containing protein [Solirubrobacteraceae bacterium]
MTGPHLEQRDAQPYVAVRRAVTMDAFGQAVDGAFPALFAWLGERGVTPAGPPLIRFLVFDAECAPCQIELGLRVPDPVAGDDAVQARALPAGRYATLLHVGPYRSDDAPDLADAA